MHCRNNLKSPCMWQSNKIIEHLMQKKVKKRNETKTRQMFMQTNERENN